MRTSTRISIISLAVLFISGAFVLTTEKKTSTVPEPEPGTLSFEFCPENTFWKPDTKKDEFYVFVLLKAGDKIEEQAGARAPLNLSLVVDKSGSMSGNKIAYTKEAVDYVINQLGENDRLSLITYSDDVNVLAPTQHGGSRDLLHKRVQSIYSGGSTNLSGGMEEGFKQVGDSRKSLMHGDEGNNYVHRVMLLSDGLANKGVVEPGGITAIVDKYFESDNVSISTFGVGADYNEELMQSIAMQGRGHYEFIETPEDLPRIFDQELQGISSLISKNTKLEITFPDAEMELDKVYQFSNHVNGNTITIDLADMFAKDQRGVLIRFKMKDNASAPFSFSGKLTYLDGSHEMKPVERIENVTVTMALNDYDLERGFNVRAEQGYALMVGNEEFDLAMKAADRREFKEAEKHLSTALSILEKHFEHVEPHPFLKEIYADMKDYRETIKELEKMKEPKYRRSFSIRQKKSKGRRFRSMSCPAF